MLSLLEVAAIRNRFGLTEADIDQVSRWVADSGIRWGRDAAHRKAVTNADFSPATTWRRGLDRMLFGFAMGRDPEETLLVLDATTGQNGISQANNFADAAGCTGIMLAKLDGTAKGGVVVSIRRQIGLPVKYVGVGEGFEDLVLFDPERFVDEMFDDAVGDA